MAKSTPRPLSPHLTVWKLQDTMVMSGLHRITGFCLTVGLIPFAWWFVAAGIGPDYFSHVQWFFGTWIGMLMLLGWTFCIFYHLGTGLRHIGFDFGHFLTKEGIVASGWAAALFGAGMTVLTWIVFFITK